MAFCEKTTDEIAREIYFMGERDKAYSRPLQGCLSLARFLGTIFDEQTNGFRRKWYCAAVNTSETARPENGFMFTNSGLHWATIGTCACIKNNTGLRSRSSEKDKIRFMTFFFFYTRYCLYVGICIRIFIYPWTNPEYVFHLQYGAALYR